MGSGVQRMKWEWYSKTQDVCSLTHKLVLILEPNSKHEITSQGQSGQQTPPSSHLIALNNHGSIHMGPTGRILWAGSALTSEVFSFVPLL